MSDLNRVQSGQKLRIPAATWNMVLDATEDYLRRRGDMGAGAGLNHAASSTIVLIKNTSGTDLERMQVLGIDTPLILPSDNTDSFAHHPGLVGVSPDITKHVGRFAVTMEPIKNNDIGLACVSGLCAVHVSITSDTDIYAEIGDGVTGNLVSGPTGSAVILWREAGSSGTVLALVKLASAPGAPVEFGHPIEDFTEGSTIELAPCDGSGTPIEDADTVVVYLAANRASLKANYTTDDIMSFVRFGSKVGSVEGVLVGFPLGGPSKLLSTTHTDTTPADASLGALIVGGAISDSTKWEKLNGPGSAYLVLTCMEDLKPLWGPVRAL